MGSQGRREGLLAPLARKLLHFEDYHTPPRRRGGLVRAARHPLQRPAFDSRFRIENPSLESPAPLPLEGCRRLITGPPGAGKAFGEEITSLRRLPHTATSTRRPRAGGTTPFAEASAST